MERETRKDISACAGVVTRTTPIFMAVSEALSVLILLGGGMVLLGWALDVPALKSLSPGLVTMKANAALCFIFSGFSLWSLQIKRQADPGFQIMARVSSLGVLGIGLGTVAEYVFRRDLGFDQFFFKELSGAVLTSSPGRMAFNTAINFSITGGALFLLTSKAKDRCLLAQILMLPVAFISAVAMVGYIFGAIPIVFGLELSTAMAVHTAVLFLFFFFGVLYCRPGCGIMTLVSSETFGGKLIRRIFPVAVTLPILLGWLKLHGERAGLISNEIGVSLVAVTNLSLMSFYIYMLSFWIEKTDSERVKTEAKVRESEQAYRDIFESSHDAIMILEGPSWKFVTSNQATIEMFRAKDEQAFCSFGPWDLSPERQSDGRASAEKAKEMIETALLKGFNSFEWTHKRLNGEEFQALVLLTRMKRSGLVTIQATVRDITARKEAEAALKQRMDLVESFNKIAVGRELKMIELKEKIKALETEKKRLNP